MKKIIGFDLDDTLAVSKSAISPRMAGLLANLLEKYEVCVISGGKFEQFEKQITSQMDVAPELLAKFHMMLWANYNEGLKMLNTPVVHQNF